MGETRETPMSPAAVFANLNRLNTY